MFAGMLDADTIIRYMERISPITIGVERRIRFVNETYRSPCIKVLGDETSPLGSSTSGAITSTVAPTVTMAVFLLISWLRIH